MNDSNENIWIKNQFPHISNYFAEGKYAKLIEDSFDNFKWNSDPPYIFCLSAVSDLLSQWRAYSQDGQGVAIGFRTKGMNIKHELPAPNIYAENTIGLAKVIYDLRSQKKKVTELCKEVKEVFDATTTVDKEVDAGMRLAFTLVDWAMVFKNPGFKEEREWRIVHTPLEKYEVPMPNMSSLKFRLNNNRIATYYSYDFGDNFCDKLICEVILGPKCKMTKREVRQFLEEHNLFKTKITLSESSYR